MTWKGWGTAWLTQARTSSRAGGAGRVLTVVGPDGTGKSTLCDALIDGLLRDRKCCGCTTASGATRPRGGDQATVTEPHRDEPYPAAGGRASRRSRCSQTSGWAGCSGRGRSCAAAVGCWWSGAGGTSPSIRAATASVPAGVWSAPWAGSCPSPTCCSCWRAPPRRSGPASRSCRRPSSPRQVRAWHDVVPTGVRRVHLDTSESLDEVVRRAEAEVLSVAQ